MPGNTVWGVVGTTTHRRKEMCSVQATFVSHSVTVGGPVAIRGHGWGAMGRAYGASSASRRWSPAAASADAGQRGVGQHCRGRCRGDDPPPQGGVWWAGDGRRPQCLLTPDSVGPSNTAWGVVGTTTHRREEVCGGQAMVAGRSVGTTTHRRTDACRGVERRHGGGTTGRGEAMDASVSASRWTTSRKDHRQDVSRH